MKRDESGWQGSSPHRMTLDQAFRHEFIGRDTLKVITENILTEKGNREGVTEVAIKSPC